MVGTIYEIFSGRLGSFKPARGTYGIEIETETKDKTGYPSGFLVEAIDNDQGSMYWKTPRLPAWKGVHDGSLRNYGVEFILDKPLDYGEAVAALDSFGVETSSVKFLRDQPGTSVHVHVNMQNETPLQMANFVTLVMMFENLLTHYSGPTRRSNCFALPTRCAEGIRDNILSLFTRLNDGLDNAISFSPDHVKYAVLNLATLSRFGSLEIRCFKGTTDTNEIKKWLGIINQMYVFSRTPGLTPRGLCKDYQQRETELLFDIFGPFAQDLMIPGYKELIGANEFNTFKIAMSVKDWYSFGGFYEAKEKVKKLKKMEMSEVDAYLSALDNQPPASPWTISPVQTINTLYDGPAAAYVITDDLEDDDLEPYIPEPDYDEDEGLPV